MCFTLFFKPKILNTQKDIKDKSLNIPDDILSASFNDHYIQDDQTLVMYSGHPMGLFPSTPAAPRAVITNGMMIPNYSSRDNYDRLFALGVTMYGQMTAGSYCYIGPQVNILISDLIM